MAASVFFLDENKFIEELEKETEKKLADDVKKKQLAFTAHKKDAVYVNQTLLAKIIQDIYVSQPETAIQLGKKDLAIVTKKSILLHEFTHENLPRWSKTFPAFSLRMPQYDQPINFDRLNGFEISGKSQDEKEIFFIEGGDEAVTERAAQIIAENSRSYVGLIPEYSSGASFVNQLNKRSEIPNDEFLKYLNGTLPPEKLVTKWGKGDFKKGVMILVAIGLNVQGITNAKETQGFIDDILKN